MNNRRPVPKNRRIDERPSPPVENRRLQNLQILRQLYREEPEACNRILENLGFTDAELTEVMEDLYQTMLDKGELEECGGCGHTHRPDFAGDCRNDDERFPGW